ncbi:peptidoglycan editing factor PgeF [Devosia sediminis]|uniref:Purine nucleoside phosphorylase n=1 Tax=Devosia sediminis TaxID=2798801 RepID=A0A934MIX3_9HYPH|nr:peptidoglycan editing factor PgeF [Devosia sediminis]MBJ3783438.1 peptidoglycan editing factor PgeF [Devosia sediminis]
MTAPETAVSLSAISGIRHGFFGRVGGVSTGEFAGLNVSTSVGDDPEHVTVNRSTVADAMGLGPLVILKQTHSNRAHTVSAPFAPGSVDADALVASTPGLALGILTADCTPILFADPEARVIGAAHAGWRGAVDGIIGNTVAAMVALGADPARIVAVYGPTIHGENYEVGAKFEADFLALHPGGAHHFHIPTGGQPHFDLPGFVAEQLLAAGIGNIEQVGFCTYAHPDRYFSHRYATHQGTRTGRQIAVIGLTQV